MVALRLTGGVCVDDALCLVACHLYNLSVACDIGNFEVESHAALLCSLQIARSTQFQVGFGNAETIVGLSHDVYALARLFSQFG